jgi:Cof subfamily protein (haloacid dehalogenase superfamily)
MSLANICVKLPLVLEKGQTVDIRLIVLDIDGTIAGESNQVSEAVKQALKSAQSQGIAVTVATGRMYHSAQRFYHDIGGQPPLIAYNGAWIQDPHSQYRHHHLPVPSATARQLLDALDHPDWRDQLQVNCYIDDRLYVQQMNDTTELYAERSGVEVTVVGDLREILVQPTTKILAMGEDTQFMIQLLAQLQQRFPKTDLHLTQSNTNFFEATHPQANKGLALRYLAEDLLGLEPQNILAIGDNFNDVEMLEYAGIGVAMGDAPTPVKAIADWVAPGVEADGVVAVLEKYL